MTTSPAAVDQKLTIGTVLKDPLVGPIIGLVLVLLAGFGLVFPVLPLFAKSFGVGNDGAGLLLAVFGFARLFGDLIGGSIVDRKGERWTATAGMAYLAVCAVATAAAPSFAAALVFWGLAGIGSAVLFASLFSYVLKAARKDRMARTLSFFYGAFNIGVIAGGAAGGAMGGTLGLTAPIYGYAAVLVLTIPLYLRFVPRLPPHEAEQPLVEPTAEAATSEAPRPSGRIVRDFLRLPGFMTTLFLNFAYLWMVAAIFNTLVPLFGSDELGMSPAAIGATFAVGIAAEFFVLFPAGALADKHGRKAVMLPSLAGMVVMMALLGTSDSALVLTLFLAVLAVFSGFAGVPPAAMLSDIVPAEHSGRAVGAFRFCGDIGFFLGPLVAGTTSKAFGFQTAFVIAAAVPAVAMLLTARTAETMRRKDTVSDVPADRG